MNKIAITTEKEGIDSQIDQRFGRCKYFLVVELDNNQIKEIKSIENDGAIQGHGAGIKAAQQLGDLGIKSVISGSTGPNASVVLEKLGITAYRASGNAKNAINEFIANKLEEISETSEPHSGMSKTIKSTGERIFFPLLDNKGENSEISQHFGHAPFFGVYDVEKKKFEIIKNDLDHSDPNKSPIDQIEDAVNPTTIFAKGIGGRAIKIIEEKGLTLKTGEYNTVKEVIDNLDKLENQTDSCGH